jgi:TRAP-type C4-dicarboxylate transport system permease small subunit
MERLVAIYEKTIAMFAFLGALVVGGMALWITYEVLMRYFLERPTFWAVDLSEYAMLWAAFLAAPWVLRREGHVRVEVFVERMSRENQRRLGIVTSALGAVVCAIMAWQGGATVLDFYARGVTVAREWQVPQFLVYLAIPIGSTFLTVEFVRRAGRYVRATEGEASFVQQAAEERTI